MTNMQLAYTEYLEDKRHHETEEETERRKADETARHNVVSEKLSESQQNLERYKSDLDAQVKREGYANAVLLQQLKGELEVALQNSRNTLEYAKLKQAKEQFDKNYQLAIRTQENQEKLTASQVAANNAKAYGSISGVVSQFVQPMTVDAKSWYKANKSAVDAALKRGTYANYLEAFNAWLQGKSKIGGAATTYTSANPSTTTAAQPVVSNVTTYTG